MLSGSEPRKKSVGTYRGSFSVVRSPGRTACNSPSDPDEVSVTGGQLFIGGRRTPSTYLPDAPSCPKQPFIKVGLSRTEIRKPEVTKLEITGNMRSGATVQP